MTSLGIECFRGVELVNVTIPSTLTTMGERTFQNCKKLNTVTWNSSIGIPGSCFISSTIKKLIIAKEVSISNIGTEAFKDCTNLIGFYQIFTDPNSGTQSEVDWTGWHNITTIGANAFENCSAMNQTVYLNRDLVYDEKTSFLNCALNRKVYTGG